MFEAIGLVGRFSIMAGFAAASLACLLWYAGLSRPRVLPLARSSFHVAVTAVFVASAALMILILKHQFQFEYVWAYSSRELPFGLLASTFYAGQEGSFLAWTLMVSIIGIVMHSYTQKRDNEREVMGTYAAIMAFLLLLILVKSPFGLHENGATPADGRGLNPLLQNFWMQIHPPILFLGFAGMAPPFALAIGALLQRKYQDWVSSALPWVAGGALLLGLGIALGGFWAYETLGWGGWWGWDPVENSSLIPWLVSVAAVHTMLTQKRTKGLVLTNFLLVILAFVTVLYSTFLTRSGVLGDASVHSFVDPGRFAFTLLVLFMFVFIDVGIALLFVRFTKLGARLAERFKGWKFLAVLYAVSIGPSIPLFAKISGDVVPVFSEVIETSPLLLDILTYPLLGLAHFLNVVSVLWLPALAIKLFFIGYTLTGRMHSAKDFASFKLLSRETFLAIGSSVLGLFTLIVLLGTSLPIIPDSVTGAINGFLASLGSEASLGQTVEPAFYDKMGLPLAIIMIGISALSLLLKWSQNKGSDLFRRTIIPAAVSAALAAALIIFGVRNFWMVALGFISFFSLVINLQIGWRIVRGNWRYTAAYVAHIGVALMLLGVIGSGYMSRSTGLELPEGVAKSAFGYNFTYVGYEPFWNGQRFYFKVLVSDDKGNAMDTVRTIMFRSNYGNQDQIFRNPGIYASWTKDLYIEPQSLYAPDPEGWETARFTRGMHIDYAGYAIHFMDFESDHSHAAGAFRLGAVFRIEKPGQAPQQVVARMRSGPDGAENVPASSAAGDLEIAIDGAVPDAENPSRSAVNARLRNPNVRPAAVDLQETLVVEASLKPFISLVWLGIILIVIGFGAASARRAKDDAHQT